MGFIYTRYDTVIRIEDVVMLTDVSICDAKTVAEATDLRGKDKTKKTPATLISLRGRDRDIIVPVAARTLREKLERGDI